MTHSGASNPRAEDVGSRGEDVYDRAIVREGWSSIRNCGSSDGDGAGGARRRVVTSVGIVVTSGDLKCIQLIQEYA